LKEWNKYLGDKLAERKASGNFRSLSVNAGLTDFYSNDYLGFAKESGFLSGSGYSHGSTGSRLISGNSVLAEETEKKLATFHNCESALLFTSGYSANTGLFSSLGDKDSLIVYDELIHASVRDGIRLSFAKSFSFIHNDLTDLAKKLNSLSGKKIIAVESVYSMDGDFAPLVEIAKLAEKTGSALIVDEAHATGIFGESGGGMVNELHLEEKVFARVITFGKAWGCHGAAILCTHQLRNFLINFSRPFIYTTALPDSTVNHINETTGKIKNADNEREKLRSLINYFRSKINGRHSFIQSDSPIQCIIIPGNESVKSKAAKITETGINVKAILSPTVKSGTERIRICLHSFNTENEIDLLFKILNE